MPTIEARVDAETKAKFAQLAAAKNISESELLRSILALMFDDAEDTKLKKTPSKKQLVKMTIRLNTDLADALKSRAKYRGMMTSRYISSLLRSHVSELPVLDNSELKALLESNRELAAAGRNVNQIARRLNEAFHDTEQVKLEMLEHLLDVIQSNQKAILQLVATSKKNWR